MLSCALNAELAKCRLIAKWRWCRRSRSPKIILSTCFRVRLPIMDPYSLITFYCEQWPRHQASGVYLPRAIIHPTRVWILHQPCDLYTGGVITHRAHRELKRIMRFVNKRQPFWQQPTHLPSSMVSFDRCACACVRVWACVRVCERTDVR